MPIKWDEKAERDLLIAMRVAENGYNSISKETWEKAAALMMMMGYEDASGTGISQRWLKSIQKDFQIQYPQAATVTPAPAPAPARQAKRKQQQQKVKAEGAEGGEEAAVTAENGRPAKKQKKNQAAKTQVNIEREG
ncbi:hypothetical protein F5B17DRAFT_430721 [Nemania serpens]|nr:hypothetical protein F5B17DRAFT_430721 [Nemania serpens]